MSSDPFAAWRIFAPSRSRRGTGGLLLSLGLIAVCIALVPQSASAAVPSQFVGIQSWEDPTATELRRLRGAKVRVFRAQLNWASVESQRPTGCTSSRCTGHQYRWGRYDRLFEQAARRGVRVLPVLLGSPRWATQDQRWVPVRGKPGYTNWKRQAFYDFARAAARRYGMRGTFWADKSYATSAVRARYWQIWNEPNLPNYWWNRPSAKEYAQLLKSTRAALRAGDLSAMTVTAGLPWSRHATIQPPDFLRTMFSVRGTAAAANFVGLHPYARTPSYVMEAVRVARRTLNRTSARSRPIWITEFGWSSSGPRKAFRVSARTQARYLRDTYRALLRSRRYYGIRGAIWFNLNNVRRSPDAWYYHTGLFYSWGRAKSSWWALNCVTTGRADFCRYGR